MRTITIGTTNDLSIKAVEADGQYFPLTESDLEFQPPDVLIKFDSGVYPGVSLGQLPQHICDIAAQKKSA